MKSQELELLQVTAETLSITISNVQLSENRYKVFIGSFSYYHYEKALSALTTVYLKRRTK